MGRLEVVRKITLGSPKFALTSNPLSRLDVDYVAYENSLVKNDWESGDASVVRRPHTRLLDDGQEQAGQGSRWIQVNATPLARRARQR